eukprot:45438-Chlamydomonas_euryale.AAC.1
MRHAHARCCHHAPCTYKEQPRAHGHALCLACIRHCSSVWLLACPPSAALSGSPPTASMARPTTSGVSCVHTV